MPTEKCLIVSFWTFFEYLGDQGESEKPKPPKILLIQGYVFKVKLLTPYSPLKSNVSKIYKQTSLQHNFTYATHYCLVKRVLELNIV